VDEEVRRVTWRLELYAGWGARLDTSWLPTTGTEEWRKIFEGEDMAGRVFAAGGAGIAWPSLAGAAAGLTSVLEQYRMHWRVADEIVGACPARAEAHLATMTAPRGLRPPSRTHPAGAWRVCELRGDTPVMLGEYADVDLAEGAAVAHRTLEARRAIWTEPLASGAGPEASAEPGWLPRVDTDMRLRAFAVEDAVDALARAAAGRYVGPEVLDERLICTIGLAAHHMIREYRTLLRAVWIDADECPHAAEHDAQAEVRLHAAPEEPAKGPAGRWRHMELDPVLRRMWALNRHPSRSAALAAVAAGRATDEESLRWAEPTQRPRYGPDGPAPA
jgi:hypothetical protein